jgi:hypothetical protein
MWHTEYNYIDEILLTETPKAFFKNRMEKHEGIPFLVDPNKELSIRFNTIRDELSFQPDGFDEDFIRLFHRPTDLLHKLDKAPKKKKNYWFSIWQKTDQLRSVGCFKLDRLEDSLHNIRHSHPDKIATNAYFTINTYFRAKNWNLPDTKYPAPARAEKNLCFLNACYSDIDVGRFFSNEQDYRFYHMLEEYLPAPEDRTEFLKSYHWEQALLQALILEEAGIIPEVSIFARSGQGIYLFWLLEPTQAFPESIEKYKRINKFLNGELSQYLPADKNALDAARVLRLHGSTHSKTGSKVCYYPCAPDKEIRTYTLDELTAFCGTQHKQVIIKEKVFEDPVKRGVAPERSKGVMVAAQNRLDDLLKIQEDMGGINHGIRYFSLLYFIRFARIAKHDQKTILKIAKKVAANCNPPYPCKGEENDIPIKDIIEREFAGRNKAILLKNSSLAKFWKVDKETAERLNLRSIKPDGAKYVAPPTSHKKKISARKEAIIKIFQKGSCYPKQCLGQLKKKYKIDVSIETVKNDIVQLRNDGLICVEKNAVGRPKKS